MSDNYFSVRTNFSLGNFINENDALTAVIRATKPLFRGEFYIHEGICRDTFQCEKGDDFPLIAHCYAEETPRVPRYLPYKVLNEPGNSSLISFSFYHETFLAFDENLDNDCKIAMRLFHILKSLVNPGCEVEFKETTTNEHMVDFVFSIEKKKSKS